MNFLKRIWVHFKRVQRGDDNKERKKKRELRKEINEKNKTTAQLKTTCRHWLRKICKVEEKDMKCK